MNTIIANVSKMFAAIEPWDVSNSVANLGPRAAELTWGNAMTVAEDWESWLVTDLEVAIDIIEDDARSAGAWTAEEIAAWTCDETLAYFVQSIASELRNCLNVDNCTLEECVETFEDTDWDNESEYPVGCYHIDNGAVMVDWHS